MPLLQQEHKEKEVLVTEGKILKTKETVHVINCTDDTIDLDESVNKLMEEHESVFKVDHKLQTMIGPAMKIELHINTPRKTPYEYQNATKAKLDQLVE